MAYHAFLQVTHNKKNMVIKALSKKEDTTHTEERGLPVYYMSLIRSANFKIEIGVKDDGMTPTGEPKMGRYVVTVDMDCAYPEYVKALTEKWPLDVKIFWFGSTDTNEDTHNWMTVTLENARVVGLTKRKSGPDAGTGEGSPDQVDIAFTYFYFHMRDHDSKLDVDWSFARAGKEPVNTRSKSSPLRPTSGTGTQRLSGTGCFVAGTPVATPSGERAIESLRVGDEVLAYDPELGQLAVGHVTRTFVHRAMATGTVALDDGTVLGATPNHPFFRAADPLQPGPPALSVVRADRLAEDDALMVLQEGMMRRARVKDVGFAGAPATVYNFTVGTHHTYFAGGVLVHNK